MRTTARTLPAALVLATAVPCSAADAPQLVPGTRVRLTMVGASRSRLVGTLSAADDKKLTVLSEDRMIVVPSDRVARLEVGWGHKRQPLRGMLIGAAGGAALFAFGNTCELRSPGEECPSRAEAMGLGAFSFGLLGLGIGALVRSDRWVDLPWPGGQALLRPAARGVGLSLSVRF